MISPNKKRGKVVAEGMQFWCRKFAFELSENHDEVLFTSTIIVVTTVLEQKKKSLLYRFRSSYAYILLGVPRRQRKLQKNFYMDRKSM